MGALIEVADPAFPLRLCAGVGLLVEEPPVEAVELGYLIHLLGDRIYSVLLLEELAHPFGVAAISRRGEEYVAEDFDAVHVADVYHRCRRRHDDAFACRAAPPDDHVHVLPIGRIVADEVVRPLRRGGATHRVHREARCDFGIGILVFVCLDAVVSDARTEFYQAPVELGIRICLGRPALHILGMPAPAERLLGETAQGNQGAEGCSQ